jgi:hypothetical protein
MGRLGFRHKLMRHHRRQTRHGRQGDAKIMRRQAQQAGMRRQGIFVPCRMLDGVRPRQ